MTVARGLDGRAAGELRERLLFADAGLERTAEGCLRYEGVPVADLAAAVGTPAYVYNAGAIRRRYVELTDALAPLPHQIQYSVKANSCLAVLRVLRDLGSGCDIVSVGELRRALAALADGFEHIDPLISSERLALPSP